MRKINDEDLVKWLYAKIAHYELVDSPPSWKYKAIAYRDVLKRIEEGYFDVKCD